jgi:hypothetical protein
MDPVSKGFVTGLGDENEDEDRLSDSRIEIAGGEYLEGTEEDFVGSIS